MSKLSDEKIDEIAREYKAILLGGNPYFPWFDFARAIEAAVLEAQKQEPWPFSAAWWALVMGAAAALEDAANFLSDSDAKRAAEGAANHYRIAANALWPNAVGKPHRWNDDGERCLDCGDKDWMADKHCSAAPVVQGMVMVPQEVIEKIEQWSRAYPTDIFPEPDFEKVREALEGSGITLDSVSASNMRHVITGVWKMIAAAEGKSNAGIQARP